MSCVVRCLAFVALFAMSGCGAPAPPTVAPALPAPTAPAVARKTYPTLSAAERAAVSLAYPDRNLVFVSFDALQAFHVGHLGYTRDTTPMLDELAGTGFAFTRTYAVSSWTVPSSMTWFTGVYPSEHKLVNKFAVYNEKEQKPARLQELSPQLRTLADLLKRRGYATAGFCGNAGVSRGFGFDQGFDVYSHPAQRFGGFDESLPQALRWLEENKDRKFFLFLHGYDVHGQSVPREGFDRRFVAPDYDGRYTGAVQEQELLREEGLAKGSLDMRPADVEFWRALYDEKIQRADRAFSLFWAEFQKLGLTENTLFVLTSDHGTELYEHGRFDHGFSLREELLRVPLVIKLPGQRAGAKIEERVSSIDLLPTILDLLAIETPSGAQRFHGTSLVPALRGQAPARDIFAETDYREHTFQRAIVTPEGWKLIYFLESQTRELYDLERDPSERHNLAAAEPQRADELTRRLFAHFRDLGHDLTARAWKPGFNPVYDFRTQP